MKLKYKKLLKVSMICSLFAFSGFAHGANFWVTGKLNRVLTDFTYFHGCMMLMDTLLPAEYDCPANGWIAIDCENKNSNVNGNIGKMMYSSALVAMTLDKRVTVYITDDVKMHGYCSARRLDIIK